MLKRNKSNSEKLLAFLASNWLGIVILTAIGLAVPHLVRYFKKMQVKNEVSNINNSVELNNAQNGTINPQVIQTKAKAIQQKYPKLTRDDLNRLETYAQGIAKALGTDAWNERPFFGVSFLPLVYDKWYEEEDKAVSLLKKCPGTFPVVAELYYNVFTRSRNLKSDLYEYLEKKHITELRATYKKYNKVWI